MRFQVDPRVIALMRKPDNSELRSSIRFIIGNQFPEWVEEVEDRPGVYRFTASDIRIGYEVDDESDMERLVVIFLIE